MIRARRICDLYLVLLLAVWVAACASVTSSNPQQAVYDLETKYGAALTIAVAYKRLPACPGPILCSDKAVVTRLQKADDAAFALMDGAQKTVRSDATGVDLAVKAAEQAVGAFSTITSTLKVK